MPGTIHRDPRWPKGVFYCKLREASGRMTMRSTGTKDRATAKVICSAWQQAEDEAASGELSQHRVAEILNETLRRIGAEPIKRISAKTWLNDWLSNCEDSTKETTLVGYRQAAREFLSFLGEPRANRAITAITLADINAFKNHLLREGRSPATVNKLIKKYLNTPFELARKSGKIPFNPIQVSKSLKVEAGTKGRFSREQVSRLLKVQDVTDA